MNNRKLTCIVCPMGCEINVTTDGDKILNIEGNSCPRGKEYAINECTNPVRTITSTIRCTDGTLLPVKTKKPIPKSKIREYMDLINNLIICSQEQ